MGSWDIGPNLTSIILQIVTAIVALVTAVLAYLSNRKTKALDAKVDAVDVKVQLVADGMQTKMIAAQEKAAVGVGKAQQVQVERVEDRALGRAEGVEQGRAESGLMPLDPLGPPP